MHHAPGISTACAPLAAVTYVIPLLLRDAAPGEVATVAYAVPAFLLVGETLALRTASLNRAQAELRRLADHDSLTGLANRGLFFRTLEQALADDGEAAVIFIDVDEFKQVNDQYGHEAGDRVLQLIATRMTATLRADDLAARWAGDEFTILLTGDDAGPRAHHVAERLATELAAATLPFPGAPRISAGVAVQRGGDGDRLIQAADEAMYRAKGGQRPDRRIPDLLAARRPTVDCTAGRPAKPRCSRRVAAAVDTPRREPITSIRPRRSKRDDLRSQRPRPGQGLR